MLDLIDSFIKIENKEQYDKVIKVLSGLGYLFKGDTPKFAHVLYINSDKYIFASSVSLTDKEYINGDMIIHDLIKPMTKEEIKLFDDLLFELLVFFKQEKGQNFSDSVLPRHITRIARNTIYQRRLVIHNMV